MEKNDEKSTKEYTAIPVKQGFEFLGYKFSNGVMSVRDNSHRKYLDSLIGKITKYRYLKSPTAQQKNAFIAQLNERITGAIDNKKKYGWMFFFSEVDDIRTNRHLNHPQM